MKRVALVTYRGCPQLTEDDQLLIPALHELGIEAKAILWDDPSSDCAAFDQVVIRSCWDYHLRLPEFLAWISGLESRNVELRNPASLIRWNVDKRYLLELGKLGILIPETCWLNEDNEASVQEILISRNWQCAVVKPTVSATAYKTRRVIRSGCDEIVRGPLMVQEFLSEIEEKGEWSLVFIGGAYSHAVRKHAAAGDFRVQTQFGGRVESATADPGLIDAAAKVLDKIKGPTLYARVDGLEQEGEFVLMELELIEPVLFLNVGGAAGRLAHAVKQSCQ